MRGSKLCHACYSNNVSYTSHLLEGLARYNGLLLAPAEGFGQDVLFAPLAPKRCFFVVDFWCLVVNIVKFSSNLNNFETSSRHQKIIPKNLKVLKKSQNFNNKNTKK